MVYIWNTPLKEEYHETARTELASTFYELFLLYNISEAAVKWVWTPIVFTCN